MTKRLFVQDTSIDITLFDLFVAEEVFQRILHFTKDLKSWGSLLLSTNILYSNESRRKTVLARILSRKLRAYQPQFDRIDKLHESNFSLPHAYIANVIIDAFNEERNCDMHLDNSYDDEANCDDENEEIIEIRHELKQIPMGDQILCMIEEIATTKTLGSVKKEKHGLIVNQIKEFEQYLELEKLHEILNTLSSFDRLMMNDKDSYYRTQHAYHQQYRLLKLLIKNQQV